MKLALVDVHTENLATVASSLGAEKDVKIETFAADVSKAEDWKDLKVKVGQKFGAVNFLVLNAGIGTKGSWDDVQVFHKVR